MFPLHGSGITPGNARPVVGLVRGSFILASAAQVSLATQVRDAASARASALPLPVGLHESTSRRV
jgi:hypothetical protein